MSSHSERWDQRYASTELVWSSGPNPFFAELIQPLSPGTALDVACGEGRNAIWLAEQGWQVDAFDFSAVGIDKARQIAAHRDVQVEFQVVDVMEAGAHFGPGPRFDLVSLIYLHTDPDSRAEWLPACASLVKPGGYLAYVGHDPDNIEKGTGGPQDPAVLPSVQELNDVLVDFEVVTGEVRRREVTADSGHGGTGDTALDTVFLARRK